MGSDTFNSSLGLFCLSRGVLGAVQHACKSIH